MNYEICDCSHERNPTDLVVNFDDTLNTVKILEDGEEEGEEEEERNES